MRVATRSVTKKRAAAVPRVYLVKPPAQPGAYRAAFRATPVAAAGYGLPAPLEQAIVDPLVQPDEDAPNAAHTQDCVTVNQPAVGTVMVSGLPSEVAGTSAGVVSPRKYPIRGFVLPHSEPETYITA